MPMLKFIWNYEKSINYLAGKERWKFLVRRKNLCRYPEEIEGISKIKFIKVLTSPALEFEFFIRSKENFKDGVTYLWLLNGNNWNCR